ncbi:xylulose 5-phosphate 3-epimerase [Elysia marginata]|uniref:Xylulose 5-phosphate 3-epimerase n=1 Tax=Elysia marginata TaxID=1093978 RepID=A0AAV4GSA0_9GAST|nr:xylulose 5-phosphate 3-epimerase [Elysia marginata]
MNLKALNYWVLGGFSGEKSPKEAIDNISEMGLDALELTFGDVLTQKITEAECKDILQYAKQKRVKLETLSSGNYWNLSLASENEEEKQNAITFTKKYIDVANWLDIHTILVVPGAVDIAWDDTKTVTSYQKVWDISTKSLKELLPYAQKKDVIIGLENVWNKFLLSPMEWKYYLEQFKSKYIGIYLDAGNVVVNGYPEHWIEILDKHIVALQVKNFERKDAAGLLKGFTDDLEKGDLDFVRLKESLKRINYRGPITAEMIPFCRLPDMVLPDMELARDTAIKMKKIFG